MQGQLYYDTLSLILYLCSWFRTKDATAQWLICLTAGGDRANFTQIHHQNFDISFLGVKLHYILGGIQMDLCLQVPSTRNAKQSCLGGRLKNRVKMVPRLLSLKLMLMQLTSSNFDVVFFINSLNIQPKYRDNKSPKKVPGTIENLSQSTKMQGGKLIYLTSRPCRFFALGIAVNFFGEIN